MSDIYIAPSADVADTARINTHLAQVRDASAIGADCVIGRGAYTGRGVVVRDKCKVQNYALVYEPAHLEAGVFIGPAAVLTNDTYPRAVSPDGNPKSSSDWEAVGVMVGEGASIGARSVCVAPAKIGAWSLVAAGSVVTRDVPDHALVAGVPARQLGWVGRTGRRLADSAPNGLICPDTGERFRIFNGELVRQEDRGE